jgi:hypothetical protein
MSGYFRAVLNPIYKCEAKSGTINEKLTIRNRTSGHDRTLLLDFAVDHSRLHARGLNAANRDFET